MGYHARSSNANHNGALLYTTEVEGGSSDETQYGHDREISCAVCSPPTGSKVYTMWGKNNCRTGTKLYQGWIGGSNAGHPGGGNNYLCMHPQPQWPPGMKTCNQNGALIYGTEYENTGAIDKNHDKDAGCVVCARKGVGSVYKQWGRTSCTNNHERIYWGLIMATHYSQRKSRFICVDFERAVHARSSNANNNGALLYTTEMEQGSSNKNQYGHDRKISCVVCAAPKFSVYTRWGSLQCKGTAKLLYK